MVNGILGSSWTARVTLIGLIACTYAGAVEINNKLLFAWTADTAYRFWIFLPEGLKLFFVMLFGWRAMLGIAIGSSSIMLSEFDHLSLPNAMFLGLSSGIAALLALWLFGLICKKRYPWANLTSTNLFCISILMGVISGIFSQISLTLVGIEQLEGGLRDALVSAFGRILGIFIFLYLALLIRKRLSQEDAENEVV